jgi:CHAT domain-containing protein
MYRAHALYKSLFSGIADPMRGVTHLVVVPSGPLASLPFGLLLASPPVSKDYAKADWLARNVAITHSPSLKSFFAARSAAPVPKAPKPLLAFGDPAIGVQTSADAPMHAGSVTCRAEGPAPASLLLGMSALPETAQEIKRISTLFGPQSATYLRTQATEAMLNSLQPQDYRVLYFATHGLLPGELKCQSEPALVLTPPTVAAKNRNEDGLLEASEISAMRLNADLVVLSACNTAGGGGKFGGEALSGLAEAFFYAGARNLVVSHWQVPSAATAQLMSRMFENLGPALANGAAKSLQLAQIKMWDKAETAHPFYWAAFVLAGDGGQAADAVRSATKGDKP